MEFPLLLSSQELLQVVRMAFLFHPPTISKPLLEHSRVAYSNKNYLYRFSRVRASHRPITNLNLPSTDWTFEQRMEEAFHLLDLMEIQGFSPDPSLFCLLLQSCADSANLQTTRTLHKKIAASNLQNEPYVANNLITAYAKCGCLESARQVFDGMRERNIVSWTTIISLYCQMGFPQEALKLYCSMKLEGKIRPNAFTYSIVLNSCTKTKNLKLGIEIHEDVKRYGCQTDGFVVSALVDMYAKCGCIEDAQRVMDEMSEPVVEAYTAMIEGYNSCYRAEEAIGLVRRILQLKDGLSILKEMGFACVIRSCAIKCALRMGQELHAVLIKFGHKMGAKTIAALVVLYEKCNKMVAARCLFDELLVKNAGLWYQMLSVYVRNGLHQESLEFYCEMVSAEVALSPFVIFSILGVCIAILGLLEGKQIQCQVVKGGYHLSSPAVITRLAKFYCSCGEIEEAYKLMKCRYIRY